MFGQPTRSPRNRVIIGVVGSVILVALGFLADLPIVAVVVLIVIHWLSLLPREDLQSQIMMVRPKWLDNRFWGAVLVACIVLLIVTLLV